MTDNPKITKVRIKVRIDADGKYAAHGYNGADAGDYDDVLYDMMSGSDEYACRDYYVIADVPTPQREEIAGTVEAVLVEEVKNEW